ncbi:MAG: diphosphomevalonate decarboxylase [Balneolaceae bacterium]
MNVQTEDKLSDIRTSLTKVSAHANIALIKYWGKRSIDLNLPATGSISLTLDSLKTETVLRFDQSLQTDQFTLDEKPASKEQIKKVSHLVDIMYGSTVRPKFDIKSSNNFPTGAGLASSASGFAALTLAVSHALELDLSAEDLSRFARQGSGSAARSLFGGFVEMKCGSDLQGDQDFAVQLFDKDYWDIRMAVAITSVREKKVGSTEGMIRTAQTSPFYNSWIDSSKDDLNQMKQALAEKDFEKMGELAEHNSFKMHGLAISANPPLLYWNASTVELIHKIRDIRRSGVQAYITMDAGPQVKVLCLPGDLNEVCDTLKTTSGVQRIITARPGPGATVEVIE